MTDLVYRLRVHDGDPATLAAFRAGTGGNVLVATSLPAGLNPYIPEDGLPSGDGQTLKMPEGDVSVGAYTVLVMDVEGETATFDPVESEPFSYDDIPGLNVGGWDVFYNLTEEAGLSGTTFVESSRGMMLTVGPGMIGFLKPATELGPHTLTINGMFAGLDPAKTYRIRALGTGRITNQTVNGLVAQGAGAQQIASIAPSDSETAFDAALFIQPDASGQISVQFGFHVQATDPDADNRLNLSSIEVEEAAAVAGFIVTNSLADEAGRQQLMSRAAAIEEADLGDLTLDEESGEYSWPAGLGETIVSGYVNQLRLIDGLTYEFTVGESRRQQRQTRILDQVDDTFGIASCIIGGPVVGGFGPMTDAGQPRWTVNLVSGDIVQLQWVEGNLYTGMREFGPPMTEAVRDYLNAFARQYLVRSDIEGLPEGVAHFPDLVVRCLDPDRAEGTATALATNGAPYEFEPIGIIANLLPDDAGLVRQNGDDGPVLMQLHWPAAGSIPQPSAGDDFTIIVYPKTISETNPWHFTGHPIDFLKLVWDATGEVYDEASRATIRAALGDDLRVLWRITGGDTAQQLLQNLVYGPFGVAARPNLRGVLELFQTRRRGVNAPVATITLDDVTLEADDTEGPTGDLWKLEEAEAANKVSYRTKGFALLAGKPTGQPIDYLTAADVNYDAVPDPDSNAIYGDHTIQFTLPGYVTTESGQFDMASWVASVAREFFDFLGRGSITAEVAVKRGVTDALIGQELVLDLSYLPTADPADSPVSQRGSTPRLALVLRRNPGPEGPLLLVQDRGTAVAVDPGLAPTFTLTASDWAPRHIAIVTVTNLATLAAAGVRVRIERATGAAEPTGAGVTVATLDGDSPSAVALPPVDAGTTVWARLIPEASDLTPGTPTAWQSLTLDDLTAPSDLAVTWLNSTTAKLTWTLGETDLPIDFLYRRASASNWEVLSQQVPGTTSYVMYGLAPDTEYVVGVRHSEWAPYTGVSPTVTLAISTGDPSIPACTIPTIAESVARDDVSAILTLTLTDPQARVLTAEVQRKEGPAPTGPWVPFTSPHMVTLTTDLQFLFGGIAVFELGMAVSGVVITADGNDVTSSCSVDEATGKIFVFNTAATTTGQTVVATFDGADLVGPFVASVDLVSPYPSTIAYRITYLDCAGSTGVLERTVQFDTILSGPADAQYLLGAPDADLENGRVVTDTDDIAWDLSVDGEVSATLPGKGQPDGLATLDADGLVSPGQLPPLAIGHVQTVADAAARLALTAAAIQSDDLIVQSDDGSAWMLVEGGDPATSADWVQIGGVGAGGVTSFNGRTGAVAPTTGDYAVADVTGAAPLASPAFTGTPTAPTQSAGDNSSKLATTAYVDAALMGSAVPWYFGLASGTADDTANQILLGSTPVDHSLQIFVNGALLTPTAYTITGAQIDLASGSELAAGDIVVARWVTSNSSPGGITIGTAGGGSPTVRASSMTTLDDLSITIPFPAGTAEGDLVLVFVGGSWPLITPSDWTSNDANSGSFVNGAVISKILTGTDISTGSVTLTFSHNPNGRAAMVVLTGGTGGIREAKSARLGDGTGTTAPVAVTTAGAAAATDLGIYFGFVGSSSATVTIDRGSTLQAVNIASCNQETIATAGTVTVTFTDSAGGLGYYNVIVLLEAA